MVTNEKRAETNDSQHSVSPEIPAGESTNGGPSGSFRDPADVFRGAARPFFASFSMKCACFLFFLRFVKQRRDESPIPSRKMHLA